MGWRAFDWPLRRHWSVNGSDWLDQFLGNCTVIPGCNVSSVAYIAVHDYGGGAGGIITKAEAFMAKYGVPIWLTEVAVGSGADRTVNDAFAKELLPLLEASPAVFRYAWYSTRNPPASWVNESSLLNVSSPEPVLTSTGTIYASLP
jgi:hypothetical protein